MKSKIVFLFVFVVLCIVVGIMVGFFMFFREGPETPSAIIVDNLGLDEVSLSSENITFVREAREILENFSVKVDYVGVNDVTLDVYRNLARYNLVILRVHSGLLVGDNVVCFFTSEPLSRQKLEEYSEWFKNGYLVNATIELQDGTKNFFIGVKPDFIRECLNDEFQDSIIIAMGCNSSVNNSMAKAFVDRKARVYIGWNRDVTVNHTDNEILKLLKGFFEQNKTVYEAVNEAKADGITGAKLTYYPKTSEVGNLRPKELLFKIGASFISDFVELTLKAQMVLLLISNWLNFSYRRFFRKF